MHYAAVILDLDGVVYIGDQAVPFAIESLNELHAGGTVLSAATNNANRPAAEVWQHLHRLGLCLEPSAVMTSAQAAARALARTLSPGDEVLAIGGNGVALALEAVGLRATRASEDLADCDATAERAAAVLVGYGPRVAWFDLAAAHWAIARGRPWYATNTDATVPLPFGLAPGNGAIVGLLERSTGVAPQVIGKPGPALFKMLADSLGTADILVIGDRLDTDIDGAHAAGMDSLFVLTGVHGLSDLRARPLSAWPSFVAQDLRSLHASPASISYRVDGLRSDSNQALVLALLATAHGQAVAETWRSDSGSPLVDLRSLREGRQPN